MKSTLLAAASALLTACLVPQPPPTRPPGQSSASPAPAPKPAGDRPRPRTFTLLVGGDVTLGFHYQEFLDDQVAQGRAREEMIGYGFREIRPALEGADLFLVNLECPFTERGEKIPKNFNFRARPELVASLLTGGVGAVSLANNHAMDYGPLGLSDTLSTLEQVKLPHFGAGLTLAEARRPAMVERGGLKIAFLGYLFLGEHGIEPAEIFAGPNRPGVAGEHESLDRMEQMLRDDIALAKSQADLVIPFFHWGKEGEHVPEPYQVRLAHAAVEAGAAAVLGSHPHVLQAMELYRGVPVVYSLGNLVFGGNWNPRVKQAALFRARFSPSGYRSSDIVPVQIDRYPERPMQPFLLSGAPAADVLGHLAEYSGPLPQMLPELSPWVPRI